MILGFLSAPMVYAATAASSGSSAAGEDYLEDEGSAIIDDSADSKAYAAAIAIGLASAGGAIGMAIAIGKSVEGIARQPEADDKIRTQSMLGLVFIETAIIYALIVAILIIFVL
ncbi:MAG: ATP synthase F0 subunit C [Lachnospiraceae bacterium]|nr:ATP synthase F0 subunit C [Lachnospiraceae bacterium]